jgi:hypothetical protein
MAVSAAEIAEQATKNDVAIITIGRISGEFYDRKSSDFWLSEVEEQLISEVAEAFHARGKRSLWCSMWAAWWTCVAGGTMWMRCCVPGRPDRRAATLLLTC